MKTKTTEFVKKSVSLFSAVLLTLSVFAVSAFAELPAHDNYVCDEAGVMDEDTIAGIKKSSDELYASKGIRVAVCTLKTTGDTGAGDMAASLLKEWKVGNGILLLLVTEDDTYYAVQSKSISGTLTNDKLRELLLGSLEPKFAEGSYSDAVSDTVSAVTSFLNENISESFTESSGMPIWLSVVLRIIVAVALLLIAGYIALVILEKRNAARQRAFLEERRRMVREGRAPYRPNGAYGMNPQQRNRPIQSGAQIDRRQSQRMAGNANGRTTHPMHGRNGSLPRQAANPYREQMRQQQNMYDPATAATVQINTADLRATKAAQDKYSYQGGIASQNRRNQRR